MSYAINDAASTDWQYTNVPASAYGAISYEEPALQMDDAEEAVFGVNPALLMGSAQASTSKGSDLLGVPQEDGSHYGLGLPGSADVDAFGGGLYPVRSSSFQSYAPRLIHSYSTSSLPPELSPASTASYSSPPSSASSYNGLVSPNHQLFGVAPSDPSQLLPSADIHDVRGPQTSLGFATGNQPQKEGSWFAEMQDSYLAHHATLGVVTIPATPQQTFSSPSNAQEHRSPARFSPSPSPCPSPRPISRTATPISFLTTPPPAPLGRSVSSGAGPDRTPRRSRRQSTSSETSTRGRRHSKLSIEVPPYYAPMANQMSSGGVSPGLSPLDGMRTLQVTEPITNVPMPSPAEMDRLMSEIGTMLGPEVLQALDSPSPTKRHVVGPPPGAQMWSRTTSQPGYGPPAMEMGGVLVSQEDMHLLESPPLEQKAYPASAPAWQTTFNLDPSYAPLPQYQPTLRHPRSASPLSYGPSYSTPTYAPHPDVFGGPAPQTSGLLAPGATPLRSGSAPGYPPVGAPLNSPRRGSSVDAPPTGYAYPSVIAPPGSNSYPGGPPYGTPPAVLSRVPQRSPPKTPKNPRRRPSKTGEGSSVAMFINYSPSDSKKLLSGVAPSGSSKRKREEELEAAAAAKLSAEAEPAKAE